MTKRTRHINLDRMRKASVKPVWKPLALAIAGVGLAGCSDNSEQVQVVYSINDCVEHTSLDEAQCEVAYKSAMAEAERSAPKFEDKRDCEDSFGFQACIGTFAGSFMPAMTGFIVAEIIDEVGDAMERRHYSPVYRNQDRDLIFSDGTAISYGGYGKYHIPKGSNVPKAKVKKPYPKGTKTLSRGGFGSTASAKSSWGGGKSSRSWGG